ncbi:MAG: sulfatase-like hydrolase/transferase [Planctomycetota bacterium]
MLRLILLTLCLGQLGCETIEPTEQPPRPNIVLIMADDLGYGDLSCYGATHVNTPHIDALARNGIRFTDYHSNGAVCSPTRAALMTGRYQQRTGVEGVITAARHREVGLPLEEVTIAEVLRDAGYVTAMYGKWHLGYDIKRFGPQRQGFDTFEGFVSGNVDYFHKIDQEGHKDWYIGEKLRHVDGYVTDLINDRAVDWIDHHQKEDSRTPFFLYLAHGAPHYPMQGPNDKGFREVGKKVREAPDNPKPIYKAMIESMDEGIGRVMATLEKHGLTENTLVIFTSDNGHAPRYGGSAGPLRGQKGTVYEGGHRVPIVMQWPAKVTAGGVSEMPVSGIDLFPTITAMARTDLPAKVAIDGNDLRPFILDGFVPAPTRYLHWVHGNKHAIRFGIWKLVMNGNAKPELYNLRDDLGEQKNLADEQPDRVERMREAHEDWLEKVRKGANKISNKSGADIPVCLLTKPEFIDSRFRPSA